MNKKHLFWIIPLCLVISGVITYYITIANVYEFLHSDPIGICNDLLEGTNAKVC